MSTPRRPNPYCGFTNDVERRRALMSRDVRLVAIAVVSALGAAPAAAHAWPWIAALFH